MTIIVVTGITNPVDDELRHLFELTAEDTTGNGTKSNFYLSKDAAKETNYIGMQIMEVVLKNVGIVFNTTQTNQLVYSNRVIYTSTIVVEQVKNGSTYASMDIF